MTKVLRATEVVFGMIRLCAIGHSEHITVFNIAGIR